MKKCLLWSFAMILVATMTIYTCEDASAAANSYVEAKKCMKCHFKEYSQWKKEKKAKAFEAIANDPDKELCYPCHTTGYGKPGGFKDPESTPDMINVQCDSCHGPGAEHVRISQAAKEAGGDPPKEVFTSVQKTPTGCAGCHNPHVKDAAVEARKKAK